MENKIANWMELGIKPYDEVMEIQDRLVELRASGLIPDTIISVQHPLTVSFGVDSKNNQFSDLFLSRVQQAYGNTEESSIMEYLSDNGASFSLSKRGGGATVFALGQFAFYPVVNHCDITGSHQLDVGAYKSVIYRTLFQSLRNLGVEGIKVSSSLDYATRNERKDAWIERGGVTLKMGSKGIGMKRGVAYHGFALNATREGISRSWMVNQCGYRPEEVKLWSVEHELNKKVEPKEVYDAVQKSIMANFGYAGFQKIDLEKLEVKNAC
ncbi:MAG: hypothetical protein AABX96_02715 [Nanoarchaeota archaeon]